MDIKLQVGVKILLKNKENKYLLLKRSPEKYENTSMMWDMVGGRINAGSDLMENLKREIKEETQLNFTGKAKLVGAQDILWPDKHIVRLTYTGEIEGEPILSDEHIDYKWVTGKEMLEMERLDPYLLELLEGDVTHEII